MYKDCDGGFSSDLRSYLGPGLTTVLLAPDVATVIHAAVGGQGPFAVRPRRSGNPTARAF